MPSIVQFRCTVKVLLTFLIVATSVAVTGILPAAAASKPHVISYGKWIAVPCLSCSGADPADGNPLAPSLALKVRSLLVDARIKEFTVGPAHEVTDRLFVVRRAFRVNDSLPQESTAVPHWQWERGGWLLVDRLTGRISPINLPEFDAFYSTASWYRDYAAYCGVSDAGDRVYAVVTQIGRRKPVLKEALEGQSRALPGAEDRVPDLECPTPSWQRGPARVTFAPPGRVKQTFVIRGHVVDLVTEEEDDEEASK